MIPFARPAKAGAALLALLAAVCLSSVSAGASPDPSPPPPPPIAGEPATPAPSRAPAEAPREAAASGTVFWANAGVEHLRRPGSAAARAGRLHRLMTTAGATLGLLAETTGAQVRALQRASHGRYAVVAGQRRGETNAVVYDTGHYRLERVVRLRSFGYHGRAVPVAVAVLRDRATGARIAALAVHHPASNTRRGTQGRWQRASWRRELRALRSVRSAYSGRVSTFLGGDFNEHRTCHHVARRGLVSPVGTVSSCPTARTRIDQLFADPTVTFTGYRSFRRGLARRVTDHAGVYVASFRLRQPA